MFSEFKTSCIKGSLGDHQLRKLLVDVRHASGEIIDCDKETDNNVSSVRKMRELAKITPSPSQTSSSSGYETTEEEEITRINARDSSMDRGKEDDERSDKIRVEQED